MQNPRQPDPPSLPRKHRSLRMQWLLLTALVAVAVVCFQVEELVGYLRFAELMEELSGPDWRQIALTCTLWLCAAPLIAWVGLRCVPGRMSWWLALVLHASFAIACAWLIFQAEMFLIVRFSSDIGAGPMDFSEREAELGVVLVEEAPWRFVLSYVWRVGVLSVVAVVPSLAMLNTERESLREQLARELAETENRLLRAQLQPHFLFNALNGIQVLIDDDPERAKVVLRLLSSLLRNTLEDAHQTLLPLTRELEILTDYLEIERLRFGDRVTITLDVEADNEQVRVPSFFIQPLVENSLIHGPGSQAAGGHIEVSIQRRGDSLDVCVSDDGPGVEPGSDPPRGHGLGILEKRLQRLFGEQGKLLIKADSVDGFTVTVRVPLLVSTP